MPVVVTMPIPGELRVAFPYDPEIVSAMRTVPTAHWSPDLRVWIVDFNYDIELADALRPWDASVVWRGCDNPYDAMRTAPPSTHETNWATATLSAVGAARVDAVFRALSKVLHPDTPTGSDDLMRQLIEARDALKQ